MKITLHRIVRRAKLAVVGICTIIKTLTPVTSTVEKTILVEISAVHDRFILDFIQPISDPLILNAFLKELEENGIAYELQGTAELTLPNIRLPWSM